MRFIFNAKIWQKEAEPMSLYLSYSPEDTFRIAEEIAEKAVSGMVISLDGELGAGKTVFTKGFAKGLGISDDISSPTFNILKSYHGGKLPLHHFDVYRIGDISEMDEIGYEDCFYGDGVSLIEWGSMIDDILPEDAIRITIGKDPAKGYDYREIEIKQKNEDTVH